MTIPGSISQAPGAEFLERRLARAAAVPPADRSPEVAAFVESVQLVREVCELLPLTDAGEPALPDAPATWRKMVLAILKFMRADYVCPAFPPTKEDASRHVTAFMLHAPPASEAAAAGAGVTEELFRVLLQHIAARSAEAHPSLRLFRELTQKLAAPGCTRRLQCQVDQLAGGHEQGRHLLTMAQPQYICHCGMVHAAGVTSGQAAGQPSESQLSEGQLSAGQLVEVSLAAAEVLQQLEPANPRSYAKTNLRSSSGLQRQKMLEWCLQAARLGREQHSDYWTLHGAACGILSAAEQPAEIKQSELAEFLAIFEQSGKAATRRCKRLLPDQRVLPLEKLVQMASCVQPGLTELLQQQQRASNSSSAAALEAGARLEQCEAQAVLPVADPLGQRTFEDIYKCNGRECQVAHWPAHKCECSPA